MLGGPTHPCHTTQRCKFPGHKDSLHNLHRVQAKQFPEEDPSIGAPKDRNELSKTPAESAWLTQSRLRRGVRTH